MFLPHELDYTIWDALRRGRRRPASGVSRPVTLRSLWLDRFLRGCFSLWGLHPDYRLIDYLVVILSTERAPALTGGFTTVSA